MLEKLKGLLSLGKDKKDRDTSEDDDRAAYLPREKLLVFSISLILALCLWFIVNLNRDFSITLHLPIEIRDVSGEMALVSDPPTSASVDVTGEGWKLITLYSNPPRVVLDVDDEEVNLADRIQRQVSMLSDVLINSVRPSTLVLEMEERTEKDVPVVPNVDLRFGEQYGRLGEPVVKPSSIRISGAVSRVQEVDTVYTRHRVLEDVRESRELTLDLESPASGISLLTDQIQYSFEVAEFTEAQITVPVRIRNQPPGQTITYNPTRVTIRYDVPINEYNESLNIRPFSVWIDYDKIRQDTTGQVIPDVERSEDDFHIRFRSVQPRRISYFTVLENSREE